MMSLNNQPNQPTSPQDSFRGNPLTPVVREATLEDVPMLIEMLQEAAQQMVSKGVDQWKPDMFSTETVQSYFEHRKVFLLSANDQTAGLFTLQSSDVAYWKERNDERYLYLHRLTVRPKYRGLNYGDLMLRYAEQEVLKLGKVGLRLDCVAHLPALNAYYERNGFQFVAEHDLNRDVGGRYVNLYEKKL